MNANRSFFCALFLSLFYSGASFGQNTLACSQNGTRVVFTNGMFNSQKLAQANADTMQGFINQLAPQIDAMGRVSYTFAYNINPGFLQNAYDAAIQLIAQDLHISPAQADQDYWQILDGNLSITTQLAADLLKLAVSSESDPNAIHVASVTQRIAQQYHDLQQAPNDGAGTKILAIGHSQGSFYVNEAFQQALAMPGFKKELFSSVLIASPTSYVASQGKWANYQSDKLIYGVSFLGFQIGGVPGALGENIPDVGSSFSPVSQFSQWFGHGLIPVYLAVDNPEFRPVKDFVTSQIVAAAQLLGPNCLGCSASALDAETGDFHTNPDGSQGGFVASSAYVDGTSYVSADSEVCDAADVENNVSIANGSTLMDHAYISNFVTVSTSVIHGNAVVYDNIFVGGSDISGNALVQGNDVSPLSFNSNLVGAGGSGDVPYGMGPTISGNSLLYLSYVAGQTFISGSYGGQGVSMVESEIFPPAGLDVDTITDNATFFRSTSDGEMHLSGSADVEYSGIYDGVLNASGSAFISNVLTGANLDVTGTATYDAFWSGGIFSVADTESGLACGPSPTPPLCGPSDYVVLNPPGTTYGPSPFPLPPVPSPTGKTQLN